MPENRSSRREPARYFAGVLDGADVAASRQSAGNCDGNSDGGFLPKAATPKAETAAGSTLQPHSEFRRGNGSRRLGARCLAMTEIKLGRIPHSALRTLHSALERLFSGIHFGMDDWGNWRLNFHMATEPIRMLKSNCSECFGGIEFSENGFGHWVSCPHCGQKTKLESDSPVTAVVAPEATAEPDLINYAATNSRAWVISRLLTGRTWLASTVTTAAVFPASVVNSTS